MKKKLAALLLAGVLGLAGCSAYHQQDQPTEGGPTIERVTPETTEAQGPTLSPEAAQTETIAPLEIGGGPVSAEAPVFNPEIMIASDIHYLAKELTDFGPAFQRMVNGGDGRMPSYVWEITDAFLEEVILRRPQALILSGDLTLEGERSSHEALARKLSRVEAYGIPVYVIPGNHDVGNPLAAYYKGEEVIPTVQTTTRDFETIYADFGYKEAVSRDPASLSYVAELPDGTWMLMLDSCQYENGALVGGMIRKETYGWLEEVLETGWFDEKPMIAVAHHNLMDQSRIYEEDCTIEHAEELGELLGGWDVKLFLSGHLHVQHYKTSWEYQMDEIVTASLSTSPCIYGVLEYAGGDDYSYHTETVDVSSWAQDKSNPDVNLQNFDVYADEFLQSVFYREAQENLRDYVLTEEKREIMAELYAILNVYAVAGKAYEIHEEVTKLPAYSLWQEYSRTDIQAMYLNEILEDAVCDYNFFKRPSEGAD